MIERRVGRRAAAALAAADARASVAEHPDAALELAGGPVPVEGDERGRDSALSGGMLLTALEQLDEIVLLIEPDAAGVPPRIVFANAAVDRLLGIAPASLTGPVLGPPAPAPVTALRDLVLRELDRDRTIRHEVSWTSPSGRVFCLDITATPCRDPGQRQLSHWAVVAREVTEQRALTERSAQAQRLESLGLLAGSIAHDFNNLVHVISGFSELAMRQIPAGTPPAHFVRQALDAAVRAASLAKQLLAFSRRQSVKSERIDMRAIVGGLQPVLARLAGPRVPVTIEAGEQPAMVCADPTQVEQILLNLVVNARDAQPNGGSVHVTLDLEERDCRRWISLRVRDGGPGMSPDVQHRVFEPFFTTKSQGTGLGLSTVHRIVQGIGGSITLDSPSGGGLLVEIELPEDIPA